MASGQQRLPHLKPKNSMVNLKPLFERKFMVADYMYADPAAPRPKAPQSPSKREEPTKPSAQQMLQQATGRMAAVAEAAAAVGGPKTNKLKAMAGAAGGGMGNDAQGGQAGQGESRWVDGENEEQFIAAIDRAESVPDPKGSSGKVVVCPEQWWFQLKRFVVNTIGQKRRFENEAAELRRKLMAYKELENLEHKIAQLQSQRIDMLRELATKEVRFAEEFSLKAKLQGLLDQCDGWCTTTKEVYASMHAEKQAFDRLRRGLKWLGKFPDLKAKHQMQSGESEVDAPISTRHRGPQGAVGILGSECRVIFRGSRLVSDRYCIITVYSHVQGQKLPANWPYSENTYQSAEAYQEGENGAEGGGALTWRGEGMAAMSKAMMEDAASGAMGDVGSSDTALLLVVVYDVLANRYLMAETLPTAEDLAGHSHAIGGKGSTITMQAIAEIASAQMYVKKLVNGCSLRQERATGQMELKIPGQRPPLRRVWRGHRELAGGRSGLFHIVVYEHDAKTWLVRLFDNSCCRLYSHYVPKGLLTDDEELAGGGNNQSSSSAEPDFEDAGVVHAHMEVLLSRLSFDGQCLTVSPKPVLRTDSVPPPYASAGTPKDSARMKEILGASEPMIAHEQAGGFKSLRPSRFWSPRLVVNHAARFGADQRYLLVRAAVSPALDMLGVILYDPLGKEQYEQLFPFSEICRRHHARMSSSPLRVEASKRSINVLQTIADLGPSLKLRLSGDDDEHGTGSQGGAATCSIPMSATDSAGTCDRKAIEVERLTDYGVSEGDLKRALVELLEHLQFWRELKCNVPEPLALKP